uniref:Choline/carnitine acyltransferase domain-containing protein n=1 Tax=Plectus sambesii TaxID=2011161 RepID=A0A914W8F2_9BILA
MLLRSLSGSFNRHVLLCDKSVPFRQFINYSSSLSGDDYQFLEKSVIPTYHFQPSLPRLPIPKLEATCDRYLRAIEPLISGEEYARTSKLVKDFGQNEGKELQKELVAYDKQNKHTSYISEPWFDMYLRSRVPCPVHYNPFMAFAPDPNKPYNDQLTRATNFVISFGRFKRSMDAEVLAPEVFHLNPLKSDTQTFRTVCKTLPSRLSWFGAAAFKAYPLDMSQYKALFNGSRIPKKQKDQLYHDPSAKHFIAIRNGHFFAVDLFDKNGNLLSPEEVHASLAHILGLQLKPAGNSAIGALTTLERDAWAAARQQLESEPGNAASLKEIDGALFALCLDDLKTEDPQRLVKSLLIGDDGSNRWFDKCFQLIVDGNGMATINFEHSWGDGVAVLRLMESSFRDTNSHHFVSPGQAPAAKVDPRNYVRKVEFNVNDSMQQQVNAARTKHEASSGTLDFATVEYPGMNRDSIKRHKLSPDAVMQLAFQIAYMRQYGQTVPTYESCSTAAFRKGRTECMRPATNATSAAVRAFTAATPPSAGELRKLMTECSKVHGELVKEASMGQGFDRHLMGLRVTADRLKRPQPAIFTDKTYQYVNQFILSTSTLSTETIVFGGFGPVVPDGFGIGYNVVGSKVGGVITAYKGKRDAAELAKNLHKSLDDIKRVLDQTQQ